MTPIRYNIIAAIYHNIDAPCESSYWLPIMLEYWPDINRFNPEPEYVSTGDLI
jgi:hypothetical protein